MTVDQARNSELGPMSENTVTRVAYRVSSITVVFSRAREDNDDSSSQKKRYHWDVSLTEESATFYAGIYGVVGPHATPSAGMAS